MRSGSPASFRRSLIPARQHGGIAAGTIGKLTGDDGMRPARTVDETVAVQAIDAGGFVTLASSPARTKKYNLAAAPRRRLSRRNSGSSSPRRAARPKRSTTCRRSDASPIRVCRARDVATRDDRSAAGRAHCAGPAKPDSAAANIAKSVTGVNDDPGSVGVADFQTGLDGSRTSRTSTSSSRRMPAATPTRSQSSRR